LPYIALIEQVQELSQLGFHRRLSIVPVMHRFHGIEQKLPALLTNPIDTGIHRLQNRNLFNFIKLAR
jgi:hypothetical protein